MILYRPFDLPLRMLKTQAPWLSYIRTITSMSPKSCCICQAAHRLQSTKATSRSADVDKRLRQQAMQDTKLTHTGTDVETAATKDFAASSSSSLVEVLNGLVHKAKEEEVVLKQTKPQEFTWPVRDNDLSLWKEATLTRAELVQAYLKLSKSKLTALVATSTVTGYLLAPGSFDPVVLALATLGISIGSASANAFNQLFESPYDAQMNRTKYRPIVTGRISPLHAFVFAFATGAAGVATLSFVNPLSAGLGLFNLLLYSLVYTPLKRYGTLCTWVGSVVGAIPPVLGWTAASGVIDPACLTLAAILYCWQFPHFNSLSWNLRAEYARAGYRMMSVTDPALCKRVAFRHSCLLLGLTSLVAPLTGLADPAFSLTSLVVSVPLVHYAWQFYTQGDSASSRRLFRFSTICYLPTVLVLLGLHKAYRKFKSKRAQAQAMVAR